MLDCLIAISPTKDKVNRRQHIPLLQLANQICQGGTVLLGRSLTATHATRHFAALGLEPRMNPLLAVVEQGKQPFGIAKVKAEGHGAKVRIDQLGRSMHLMNPIGELIAIGNSGGKGDELNFWRAIDDGFFPNCAALAIVHVMAFV